VFSSKLVNLNPEKSRVKINICFISNNLSTIKLFFKMKNSNLIYWILTGLMAVFMGFGAVLDVIQHPEAVAIIKHLGYPDYFIPFIGVLKILGVISVLVPSYPFLKEWAYAGLTFDTFGATYSHIASGDSLDKILPAFIAFILILASYILYKNLEIRKLANK
jgi:DoxX-like family